MLITISVTIYTYPTNSAICPSVQSTTPTPTIAAATKYPLTPTTGAPPVAASVELVASEEAVLEADPEVILAIPEDDSNAFDSVATGVAEDSAPLSEDSAGESVADSVEDSVAVPAVLPAVIALAALQYESLVWLTPNRRSSFGQLL